MCWAGSAWTRMTLQETRTEKKIGKDGAIMKIIITSLLALSFAAGLTGDASAATNKQKKLPTSQYGKSYAGAYGYRGRDASSVWRRTRWARGGPSTSASAAAGAEDGYS